MTSLLNDYPLLKNIDLPADVRKLDKEQLHDLSKELREYLTHTVSLSGGHFSAGLGTVELTVALHYIFNTPEYQLVWDVGHQAYPHKILTGRKVLLIILRHFVPKIRCEQSISTGFLFFFKA
jgi:1-deoxy-D-xylulose-5-phosphate synthase